MTTTERVRLRGVSRPRARQILAGAMVAKATMTALDVRRVDVCPWALREGILLHYLQTSLSESWELPLAPVSRTTAQERPPIRALPPAYGDGEPR